MSGWGCAGGLDTGKYWPPLITWWQLKCLSWSRLIEDTFNLYLTSALQRKWANLEREDDSHLLSPSKWGSLYSGDVWGQRRVSARRLSEYIKKRNSDVLVRQLFVVRERNLDFWCRCFLKSCLSSISWPVCSLECFQEMRPSGPFGDGAGSFWSVRVKRRHRAALWALNGTEMGQNAQEPWCFSPDISLSVAADMKLDSWS